VDHPNRPETTLRSGGQLGGIAALGDLEILLALTRPHRPLMHGQCRPQRTYERKRGVPLDTGETSADGSGDDGGVCQASSQPIDIRV
jgi:hypothetical protein